MRRLARVGSILFTLILLLVSVPSIVQPVKVVHASVAPSVVLPKPWWWVDNNGAFSQYDTYQYNHGRTHNGSFYSGTNSDSHILSPGAWFQGVAAIGPRPIGDNGADGSAFFTADALANPVYEWECVELVKRYLFLKYGVRPISSNGDEVVDNYATTYPNLFTRVPNDGTHIVQPGDVLSYTTGHTVIVSDTSGLDANGTGTIRILEQNASSTGWADQSVEQWVIKNGVDNYSTNGDTVAAWLHGPATSGWLNGSPGGTTADWITSLYAFSTSHVWAVGYENLPGYGKRPATYFYNGTSWTKYMPWELVNSYYNHWLYGVTVSSTGDIFTVGGYAGGGSTNTLAYHWVGYWKRVTSANPAPSGYTNTLRSVGTAGSNIFAVGVYWPNGSTKLPLLEKWNGSSFVVPNPTLSLPSGDTSGELNGVAFNPSGTSGWAVGNSGNGSGYSWVAYHWNGSSWETPLRGDSTALPRGNLKSIAVVSDSEAWAVGTQGTSNAPLIMHYTTADGWQEYPSGYYPPGISLNSVATDGINVWIAGWDGSVATTLHYFGYGWARVDIPSDFSATTFQAVAVVSGQAWAGGQYGAAPNPIIYQYITP